MSNGQSQIQRPEAYRIFGLLIAILGAPAVGVYLIDVALVDHTGAWVYGSLGMVAVMLLGASVIQRGNTIRRHRRREQA